MNRCLEKLVIAGIALVLVLALVIMQGNSVLARSNAYNQRYWNARNSYMNGGYFDDYWQHLTFLITVNITIGPRLNLKTYLVSTSLQ